MSAEHGERRPELRETMSGAIRKISEQSSELIQRVVQALKDDGPVDVDSLIAAYRLNTGLNQTLGEFLENQGRVVFPEGQSVQPPVTDNGEKSKDEPSLPEGPRIFGELLRAKIDSELLPADKDSFLKSEIFEAAKEASGVRRAALAEGISARKSKLTREHAIKTLYRFFITPQSKFKNIQPSYSLQEFRKSFAGGSSNGSLINELSQEIGYDWMQSPTIDYQTAMELRGLIKLEKIVTGKKVARKGRLGAQFVRKSTLPTQP